jgi:hypothetical protein
MPIVLNKDFWNDLGEKTLRKCRYVLYILECIYLSAYYLVINTYLLLLSLSLPSIPIREVGIVSIITYIIFHNTIRYDIMMFKFSMNLIWKKKLY